MISKLTVHTDGGARGNPGPAAIGIVVACKTSLEEKIFKRGKYLGSATNNFAEYSALLEALILCKHDLKGMCEDLGEVKDLEIECYLDSELVVKQLNGLYKVKDANLAILCGKVKTEAKEFKNVKYSHIPRAQNKEADKIVNEVLDSLA